MAYAKIREESISYTDDNGAVKTLLVELFQDGATAATGDIGITGDIVHKIGSQNNDVLKTFFPSQLQIKFRDTSGLLPLFRTGLSERDFKIRLTDDGQIIFEGFVLLRSKKQTFFKGLQQGELRAFDGLGLMKQTAYDAAPNRGEFITIKEFLSQLETAIGLPLGWKVVSGWTNDTTTAAFPLDINFKPDDIVRDIDEPTWGDVFDQLCYNFGMQAFQWNGRWYWMERVERIANPTTLSVVDLNDDSVQTGVDLDVALNDSNSVQYPTGEVVESLREVVYTHYTADGVFLNTKLNRVLEPTPDANDVALWQQGGTVTVDELTDVSSGSGDQILDFPLPPDPANWIQQESKTSFNTKLFQYSIPSIDRLRFSFTISGTTDGAAPASGFDSDSIKLNVARIRGVKIGLTGADLGATLQIPQVVPQDNEVNIGGTVTPLIEGLPIVVYQWQDIGNGNEGFVQANIEVGEDGTFPDEFNIPLDFQVTTPYTAGTIIPEWFYLQLRLFVDGLNANQDVGRITKLYLKNLRIEVVKSKGAGIQNQIVRTGNVGQRKSFEVYLDEATQTQNKFVYYVSDGATGGILVDGFANSLPTGSGGFLPTSLTTRNAWQHAAQRSLDLERLDIETRATTGAGIINTISFDSGDGIIDAIPTVYTRKIIEGSVRIKATEAGFDDSNLIAQSEFGELGEDDNKDTVSGGGGSTGTGNTGGTGTTGIKVTWSSFTANVNETAARIEMTKRLRLTSDLVITSGEIRNDSDFYFYEIGADNYQRINTGGVDIFAFNFPKFRLFPTGTADNNYEFTNDNGRLAIQSIADDGGFQAIPVEIGAATPNFAIKTTSSILSTVLGFDADGNIRITGVGWGIFPNRVGIAGNGVPNKTGDDLQVDGSAFVRTLNFWDATQARNDYSMTALGAGARIFRLKNFGAGQQASVLDVSAAQNAIDGTGNGEATLALVRDDGAGSSEVFDIFNNRYNDAALDDPLRITMGFNIQKRGSGVWQDFQIFFDDGDNPPIRFWRVSSPDNNSRIETHVESRWYDDLTPDKSNLAAGDGVDIGNTDERFRSLWARELQVTRLVRQEEVISSGGRFVIATGNSELATDIDATQTTLPLVTNNVQVNDIVKLEARGNVEWMQIGVEPVTIDDAADLFYFAGDVTDTYVAGRDFQITLSSSNNNGTYTVASSAYDSGANQTTVDPAATLNPETGGSVGTLWVKINDENYEYRSVTRDFDATGANAWKENDGVFNSGTDGDSFMEVFAQNTIVESAAQQSGSGIAVWQRISNANFDSLALRFTSGNLKNKYNVGAVDSYGMAAGNRGGLFIVVSPDVGIAMYDGNNGDEVLFQANQNELSIGAGFTYTSLDSTLRIDGSAEIGGWAITPTTIENSTFTTPVFIGESLASGSNLMLFGQVDGESKLHIQNAEDDYVKVTNDANGYAHFRAQSGANADTYFIAGSSPNRSGNYAVELTVDSNVVLEAYYDETAAEGVVTFVGFSVVGSQLRAGDLYIDSAAEQITNAAGEFRISDAGLDIKYNATGSLFASNKLRWIDALGGIETQRFEMYAAAEGANENVLVIMQTNPDIADSETRFSAKTQVSVRANTFTLQMIDLYFPTTSSGTANGWGVDGYIPDAVNSIEIFTSRVPIDDEGGTNLNVREIRFKDGALGITPIIVVYNDNGFTITLETQGAPDTYEIKDSGAGDIQVSTGEAIMLFYTGSEWIVVDARIT